MAIKMKTWEEMDAYIKARLKPMRFGPKGQPIYNYDELIALDIIWPDDNSEDTEEPKEEKKQ